MASGTPPVAVSVLEYGTMAPDALAARHGRQEALGR